MTTENKETGGAACPELSKGKEKKNYLLLTLERRRKAGLGARYYHTALENGIPTVFCRHDGQHIAAIIFKDGRITFTLKTSEGRVVVEKTDLQFSYRARSHGEVNQAIRIDERVQKMKNKPIIDAPDKKRLTDFATISG